MAGVDKRVVLYLSRDPGTNGVHRATADLAGAVETVFVDDLERPLPYWLTVTPTVVLLTPELVTVYRADAALAYFRAQALDGLDLTGPRAEGAGVDELASAALGQRTRALVPTS